MMKHRRNFTPEQKVSILREHQVDRVPVSDLCDKYGLQPTVFYRRQKEMFENAPVIFQRKNTKPRGKRIEGKVAALGQKLLCPARSVPVGLLPVSRHLRTDSRFLWNKDFLFDNCCGEKHTMSAAVVINIHVLSRGDTGGRSPVDGL